MIGQKFGRLTVVSTFSKDKQLWCNCTCECDLEKIHTKRARHLRRGVTKSCGCFRREQCRTVGKSPNHFKLPVGEAAFRNLCLRYKKDAEKRGLPFELAEDEIREFTQGLCFYCGIPPSQVHYGSPSRKSGPRNSCNGSYTYNGIDRLNSKLGYTKDNCVSCCATHNYMKRKLSYEEFIVSCQLVADWWVKKAQQTVCDGLSAMSRAA